MRRLARSSAIFGAAAVVLSSVAVAAVSPRPGSDFFYVSHGHFSITLVTTAKGRQIGPGKPDSAVLVSDVLLVCPSSSSTSVSELLVGFPGVKLKLSHGHYRFTISYRWKHPRHNIIAGPGAGSHTILKSASVKVNGTVSKPKLITGTVSVKAHGCTLPTSHYRAAVTNFSG
jgi:hypothetical protein